MKPHYRVIKPLHTDWYHCTVLPELGLEERHGYHCALFVDTFGEAVRMLGKLATQPNTEKESN